MATITNLEFKKLHDEFTEELKSKGRTHATVIAYAKDIEQLLNYFSQEKAVLYLKDITIEELEAFKEDLNTQGYTPKSVSRKINSTRTFFKFLVDKGTIQSNPSEKLSHPKFEMKPPRVLSKMEYYALRDICSKDVRLYSIIEVLLQTGIRIGELANLKLEDIRTSPDGKVHFLHVRAQGSHPSRPVPLNQRAYNAIQSYIEIRPESEDDTLFITKNGRPLLVRNIRTAIDKAFEKAEISNAKVNDLRNSFIAHHLANGVSLVTVSKLVGHKRLSTTEKYLNLVASKTNETDKSLGEL